MEKKEYCFEAGMWRAQTTPTMVLSVKTVYWDDTYESTAPTTRSDGGDKSKRVHNVIAECVPGTRIDSGVNSCLG